MKVNCTAENIFQMLERKLKLDFQRAYECLREQLFPAILNAAKGDRDISESLLTDLVFILDNGINVKKFTYQGEAKFFSLCKRIWTLALPKIKKKYLTIDVEIPGRFIADSDDMEELIQKEKQWEFFKSKVENLSEKRQNIVKLRLQKMQHKDIAEQLGMTPEAVRMEFSRTVAQLKKEAQKMKEDQMV